MRLHRLRVTAFQAFAGSEEVDFDALGEAGLFLLHGDTGAGKTTLLDAVCFALYGDVPGARARDARLRSDHADADTRTEVELDVTLRERRLRIVRRPRQSRPKVRGDGVTEEGHTCTVQELGEDGDWRVLASRPEEAKAELADLLGMTCDQFCQVVLLPQGEFATFLRSDSSDRQTVLERLFGTDRFTRVEHWLTERRKAAAAELRARSQTVRDVVSRLAEAGGDEPAEGWEDDLAGVQPWAGDLGVAAQAGAATAEASHAAAATARAAAEQALAAGAELADRRTRLVAARDELARWEQGREARNAAEAELAAARRAAPVAALLATANERANDAAAASADAATTQAAAISLHMEGADRASPAWLRDHAAELRSRAGALGALVIVEERLARNEAELVLLAARADEAAAEARAASEALTSGAQERARLDAAMAAARAAGERAERLTAETAAARERALRAGERDRHTEELTVGQDRLRAAIDAELTARGVWLELREQRLAGIAAELAAGLQPEEPCPVCGAIEHPAPAHAEPAAADASLTEPAAADVSPAEPAAADTSLAERERRAQDAHAAAAEVRTAADREVSRVQAALAAARAVAGDEDADALADRAHTLATELEAAQTCAAGLPQLEQAHGALAVAMHERERVRQAAEQTETAARATHRERSATLAADREQTAQARADAPSVAARVTTLCSAAETAENAAAALEHASRTRAAAEEASAAAETAAGSAAFEDAAAARAAVRDEPLQRELERRIRAFDDGIAERRSRAEDPALVAAAVADPPDVAALRANAEAAAAADAQGAREQGLAQQRLAAVTRLASELDDALAALAPVAERERRVRELAALVDGSSASNRLRMRLSAYVLAARLEEVAAAATVRLERMSNGRYQLVHSDEGARGRSRGGLELRIVDGWTGRERPPSTLSGGETFLASLALALGLADVVAAEAGGSRLETLFIDEGFGSLDERTLEEVLDVLDGLREGGRVVGIVSHVAELHQRIPARLHVVKGRHGSHVEQRDAAVPA